MPPRYKAGLSDSTAKKRRVFWTKLGKYPYSKSEYEKAKHAPGDSKETTPSKYTTAYKNKFGEDLNENAALDKTLATKSKASGIPRGILRQVYNRGMAAWVTGHRPGASQQAWGMGRVNSFIVKGKTWHTTDSDLAKKVRSEQVDEHIVHSKKGWTLFSKKTHKRLGGPYTSKEQAIKRERQVQYFKYMGENNIKTFKQFSEEQEDLYIDPKGDQEVILELDIPSEVKKNIDAGFDLLKQNDNKGANSSIIAFAKKLQSGEQADKDMLALWQAKFKIHQTSKDRGWGKKSDKELQQLLAKATPDGYIPWMLLGGNEGKKFVDDALQSVVKEESLNEVSPEGIAAMRLMGMQKGPEGDSARRFYEKITKKKWYPPEDTNKKQPTPAAKPTPPSPTSPTSNRQSELSSFLRQIAALGFFFIKQESVPGKKGMIRLDYSNTGKIHKELRRWDLRLYTGSSRSQGNLGWYLFSPDSEIEEYDSGKTLREFLASIQEVLDIDK